MIVKIISKLGSKASARLRKGAKGFDLLAKTRQLTMDETGIAFFFIGPKTYQTLATHPQIIVKNMMRIAGKKFKFAILPDTAANPAKAWHQKRHDIYSDRLADDLKAGHGGGADYWQGATSAESAALVHHRNPRRIFSKIYQLWLKAKNKLKGKKEPKMPWRDVGVYWGLSASIPRDGRWRAIAQEISTALGQGADFMSHSEDPGFVVLGYTFPTEEDSIGASWIIKNIISTREVILWNMKVFQVVKNRIALEYDPWDEVLPHENPEYWKGLSRNIARTAHYQLMFTRGINALPDNLKDLVAQAAMVIGQIQNPEPSFLIMDPEAAKLSTEDEKRTIRSPYPGGTSKVYIKKDDFLRVAPEYKEGVSARYVVTAMLAEEY